MSLARLGPCSRWPRPAARGVTLLELMIVIAMVGIIAAIAAPNLTPLVQKQRAVATTEAVANLLDRARRKAIATGACHRVRLDDNRLLLEPRTLADCVSGPALDDEHWGAPLDVLVPEPGVTLTLESAPGNKPHGSVFVLRPNGRLFGDGDLDLQDDGARVLASPVGLSFHVETRLTPLGRTCTLAYEGQRPLMTPVRCGPDSRGGSGPGPSSGCASTSGGDVSLLVSALLLAFGFFGRRPRRERGRPRARRRTHARGYLLIEVLVSGVVLAIILGGTVSLVATHRLESAVAARRAQAKGYAQEALNYAVAQMPPACRLPSETYQPGPLHLTCNVAEVDKGSTLHASTKVPAERLFEITITVTHPKGKGESGEAVTTTQQVRLRSRGP